MHTLPYGEVFVQCHARDLVIAVPMFGPIGVEAYSEIDQAFPAQLERLIDVAVKAGPRSKA